jgi:hypothetical protein
MSRLTGLPAGSISTGHRNRNAAAFVGGAVVVAGACVGAVLVVDTVVLVVDATVDDVLPVTPVLAHWFGIVRVAGL